MNAAKKPILTMADALERLEEVDDITPKKRCEMKSAVRTLFAAAGRSPGEFLAQPPDLRQFLETTPWQATNLSKAAWQNKISLLKSAMRAVGINVDHSRRRLEVSAEWREVLESFPKRHLKPIAPFANWASALGITPDGVDAQAFERYRIKPPPVQRY